jgi:simple sugar transport system permease protein
MIKRSWAKVARRGAENLVFPLISILLALAASSVIMESMGYSSVTAFVCLLKGSFGSINAIGETLVKATSLIFVALSFAFAMRSGMFNLGGMGQFYIGALLGGWVGYSITGLAPAVHIPLMLLCGFIGGALYALPPALLKIYLGANELISTIMLNSIAAQILSMFVAGPMKDTNSINNASQSPLMQSSVELPVIVGGTRLHAGFLIAVLLLVLYWLFYSRSVKGFEVRVVGLNQGVAQYAGLNIVGNRLFTMLIGGGLAGIGGCVELMSVQSRIVQGFSSYLSFQGISVALLGNCSPGGIFFASVLYGALNAGSSRMQMIARVPVPILDITQALIILFLAGRTVIRSGAFNRIIRKTRRAKA